MKSYREIDVAQYADIVEQIIGEAHYSQTLTPCS